jgi:hypothetical protein
VKRLDKGGGLSITFTLDGVTWFDDMMAFVGVGLEVLVLNGERVRRGSGGS